MTALTGQEVAVPFNENREQILFWERSLFGPEFLYLATQVQHEGCAMFYKEMSAALEACPNIAEAVEVGKAIKREVPNYIRRAQGCPSWLAIKSELAQKNEIALAKERQARIADRRPSFYDRRSKRWVIQERWRPVPYVDDKLLQS